MSPLAWVQSIGTVLTVIALVAFIIVLVLWTRSNKELRAQVKTTDTCVHTLDDRVDLLAEQLKQLEVSVREGTIMQQPETHGDLNWQPPGTLRSRTYGIGGPGYKSTGGTPDLSGNPDQC